MKGAHSAKTKENGKQIQVRKSKEVLSADPTDSYILLSHKLVYVNRLKAIGRSKAFCWGYLLVERWIYVL